MKIDRRAEDIRRVRRARVPDRRRFAGRNGATQRTWESKPAWTSSAGKMTWPSLVGVEAAQKKSRELWTQAEEALAVFGDSAWFLREFAEALAKRKK